jgi:hypothetical protein
MLPAIDKNLGQMYADLLGLKRNYPNRTGMAAMYHYLLLNKPITESAIKSFSKAEYGELKDLSQKPGNYISSRFYDKNRVSDYYEDYLVNLQPKLNSLEVGGVTGDDLEVDMEMTAYTVAALMYFSDTSGETLRRDELIKELPRNFIKGFSLNKANTNSITVFVRGGLTDEENKKEFDKIDFSVGGNSLQFAAAANVNPPNVNFDEYNGYSLLAAPLHRIVYFPEELKERLFSSLVAQGVGKH